MIGTKRRNASLTSIGDDTSEKFTDVVNWLNTNTGNEDSRYTLGTKGTEKKNAPETNRKEPKTVPEKLMFGMPNTHAGLTTSLNPSWSFGLSASSQALSQSSSVNLTTSWSSGVFANSKSLLPVKSSDNPSAPLMTTSSFTTSTSSVVFSNSQTPFNFGNQSLAPSNDTAKDDVDEESEPEQPSSPSLKSPEEKGIVVVHEAKCKLYIKSTDPADKEPWKDKGTGQLFTKCQEGVSKGSNEYKPRILVGRIMLNTLLHPGIKTNLQKNAILAIFHTSGDSGGDSGNAKVVARTFLIRTKNEEERNKLADAIRDHAPAP